jgi:hypothetical protein
VSDEFTVPLCREHPSGDEPKWWKDAGVDAITIARDLWAQTPSISRTNATGEPSELN